MMNRYAGGSTRTFHKTLNRILMAAIVGLLLTSGVAHAQWDENKGLCEDTGGEWVETSCGDYNCGQPPLCLALIPGCNCGPGLNFDDKEGCYKDEACPAPGECTNNWECAPCGTCEDGMCVEDDGNPPECYTDEDCGPGGKCLADLCPAKCIYIEPVPSKKEQCESTGGTWDPNSCGDYICGEPPLCEAIIPGCNCGPDMIMTMSGCKEDITCGGPEPECETDEDCGECFAFCGDGTCYYTGLIQCENDGQCDEGFYCDECGQCAKEGGETMGEGGGDTPKELCEATGGKWDPNSCGDYTCGAPQECLAIDPGCDCGPDMNMTAEGCMKDPICAGEEEGGEATEEEGGEATEEEGGEATEEEGGEATEEEGGEATEEEGGEATEEEGGEATEEEGGEATEEEGGEGSEEDGGGLPDYAEFESECQEQGLDFSTKTTSCTPVTCEEALGEGDGEENLAVDQCETEYPGPGCVCPEETPITHPELGCITIEECPTDGEEEGGEATEEEGGEIQSIDDEDDAAVVNETAADEGCQSSHDGKPLAAAILFSVLVLLGGLRRKFSINL